MKVTHTKQKFQPVSITFETQVELDVFTSLFNVSKVAKALDSLLKHPESSTIELIEALEAVGANANVYHDFFYRTLNNK